MPRSNLFGVELILDLHDCNVSKFNRKDIKDFLDELCEFIDMEQEDLYFWDYEGDPEGYKNAPSHLRGVSAVQFIKTSSIVIHTLDDPSKIYINIFSCKTFGPEETAKFVENWFEGRIEHSTFVKRD